MLGLDCNFTPSLYSADVDKATVLPLIEMGKHVSLSSIFMAYVCVCVCVCLHNGLKINVLQASIWNVFDLIDRNRTGTIRKQDFKNSPALAMWPEIQSVLDLDGDGVISQAEWLEGIEYVIRFVQYFRLASVPCL